MVLFGEHGGQAVLGDERRREEARRDQQHRHARAREGPAQLGGGSRHAQVVPEVEHPRLLQRLQVDLQLAQQIALAVAVGDDDPVTDRLRLFAGR
ncbi:hypothetical protein OV079_43210 [Nannocystis pusilla]|uniref:Uncharacterized protein n=1 Tax=Nannocystis pusilla TaxID=889268 RepID=A0A9X3EXJ2_9BACT|nr:hypothetical protein [Nannocystis pusilla]MCY1012233.1 hypothetical protein [Nannocystis pusilla]